MSPHGWTFGQILNGQKLMDSMVQDLSVTVYMKDSATRDEVEEVLAY